MGYKETLLKPIMIGSKECKNRFMAQSMECVDSDAEGNPTDLTLQRYENLYKGEFGLVDLEAITVTNESRARKTQLEIMPRNEKALERFIRSLKEVNPDALIVFQLTHSGEISESDFSRKVCVKPTYGIGGEVLTEEEVDHIIDQFVLASKIAESVGADGIDMKLCHGYLGSQIIRPFNDRDWKYGGSWERRSAFAYDLMERIKAGVQDKDFLIGSKMSMWEGYPGGFGSAGPDSPLMDMTEPLDLIRGLEERGASYFIESLGNVHSSMNFMESIQEEPYMAYLHMYFANMMKQALKPETVVVGSNFSAFRGKKNKLLSIEPEKSSMFAMGARVIEDGMMDMIGLGRQSFADPLTPLKLREGREDEIKYCTQCMNCEELMIRQQPVGCVAYNRPYAKRLVEIRKEMGKLTELHT
ncbi:oxidoreductase [Hespellia stercorisuis]|uniref:2,4-dienoyl-CoA reductase n=1 Tax=Hespellia stercorisuis DSM 15480 TaxID=1121950 RepID=A0A1M6RCC3_9FIRM|nr:2,4-dienoyl-CoA reductase [Hespellia stercorisuis]SHK30050.1 2,4-dienoyl-CoA reductase [Hespellia stercorisuis DSM 15480]